MLSRCCDDQRHSRDCGRGAGQLRPLALFAACIGLLAGGRARGKRKAQPRRPRAGRTRRGRRDVALPAGAAPATRVCIHVAPTSVAANGAKTVVPAARGVPVSLRLLLRVSHRDRFGRHVQHGDGGDAGAGGRGRGASVPFLPGVQRVGADLPPADERLAGRGSGQRSGGRPDLLREPAGGVEGLSGP